MPTLDRSTEGGLEAEWEAVEHALDSPARRRVLSYLEQAREPVDLDELAEYVAKHTTGPESNLWGVHDTYTELRWVHLPELAKADLIAWEPDDDTVELDAYAMDLPLFSPLSDRVVRTDGEQWH
ncbi:DUF7344 domain-containing protein [Haloarchaeobius amylolyticus]|uniref:DUF7344 domain-containing protein n=1 Tax=Haloarchaeobius amylolyticus TaxID=1198296 RepID=UPI002271A068|nr:hypothetical protein [Haloarchaeobius amylolyticus]